MAVQQVCETPLIPSSHSIRIRVYLNKDLDATIDFDKTEDRFIDMEYEERDITLEDVEIDSKLKFRKMRSETKARIRDKTYNVAFFSYHEHLDIEDDDDLATEIETMYPDSAESDEEGDPPQTRKMVELRIVFKKSVQPQQKEEFEIKTDVDVSESIAESIQKQPSINDHEIDEKEPGAQLLHPDNPADEPQNEIDEKVEMKPLDLMDPITHKIMASPTMIVSSLQVYDNTTVKKWLESKRCFDPITGIPLSLGGWPVLLQYRKDIQNQINAFLKENPSFKSEDEEKEIEWESLFKVYDEKIKDKCERFVQDQSDLERQSQQLLKPCSLEHKSCDEELGVEYNEAIILEPDIPVILIAGPSRNGKSTLVNGILGVKDACKTSTKANVALTKGAWIAKYSLKCNDEGDIAEQQDNDSNDQNVEESKANYDEFYLLDMEGLSVDVTQFTKRLFYACYAIANVVVWNDKNVASDEFRNLMNELKQEMEDVATSDKKPSFMYLKRDAGDYDYDPFETLDEYINKDASMQWFRDMNIFSSLSAYELNRPSHVKKGGLNFHSKHENRALLQPLNEKLLTLSASSPRFALNSVALKQQLKHINKSTGLSMIEKFIVENKILRLFLLAPKNDPMRRRDMIYVACEFDWDHRQIKTKFEENMNKIKPMLKIINQFDSQLVDRMRNNMDEVYQRVKNKISIDSWLRTLKDVMGTTFLTTFALGLYVAYIAVLTVKKYLKHLETASIYAYETDHELPLRPRDASNFSTNNYLNYSLGNTDHENEENM
eukprot:482733_1